MEKARSIFYAVVKEKIFYHFKDEDVFDIHFEGVGEFEGQLVFIKPISGVETIKYMNQELLNYFSTTVIQ